ncbi:MAG: hypothetical protein OXF32_01205 [Anaerolineaceae bacterium]|nr:hypothetical protein [Anaerolineaceae bacterium]
MTPTRVQLIDEAEELLEPRERALLRIARVLLGGALANGAALALTLLLALAGALRLWPGYFATAQGLLAGGLTLAPDTAMAVVMLLLLADGGLLLVLMTGVLAREFWALPGLGLLLLVNLAGLLLGGLTLTVVTLVPGAWALALSLREARSFRINPVMRKEFRGRMRGPRSFIVLTVYLGLMSAFTALLYLVFGSGTVQGTGSAAIGAIGRVLFIGLVSIELLLILFIAPAFTAGAITGEREFGTWDLLQTTLLVRPALLIGKLESALGYILLLLFSSIPLQSIAFLFGGVTLAELVVSFAVLSVTAIVLGTLGIYFSAHTTRTLTASMRAYTVALGLLFGIPLLLNLPLFNAFVNAASGFGSGISASPVLEAIFVYVGFLLVSLNPVATALVTQQLLADRNVAGLWTLVLSSDGSTIPLVSPWISLVVFYLLISTILVALAVRRMRKVEA